MVKQYETVADFIADVGEDNALLAINQYMRHNAIYQENRELSEIARQRGMTLSDIRRMIEKYEPRYMQRRIFGE
jgi:DNA-binding MarR family transcriptional regulator